MFNNFYNIIIFFILLNIFLYLYNHYFNKIHYYYNQLFSNYINIECYTNKYNDDYFILYKKCSRPIIDYKSILNCALVLLDDMYSNSGYASNQVFNFLIFFVEVDHKTNLPVKLLSDPIFFDYNIKDPISLNELYKLIRWNTFTYKNNLNKIVVSIRRI